LRAKKSYPKMLLALGKIATPCCFVMSARESMAGDGRVADTGLKIGEYVQFFAERVEDPTDNKPARCFAIAADAHPLCRQWRSVVIGPGASWADDDFTDPIGWSDLRQVRNP
jgi:hypothetical protein